MAKGGSAEKVLTDIFRKTRHRFSAEEMVRIVLEGLRGKESIATLCRREGIVTNLHHRWNREFLQAGKKRLLGDTPPLAAHSRRVWNAGHITSGRMNPAMYLGRT